ncbi:uracil DNA glycosylase [Polyrhizophydium stewartii]|uniref:Uracil-DNA glycosylase n=1 Tax=Polyrhizophydium stewartii TaxID=2732419 RepID=A0ABR4N3V7_9FUNG
MTRTIKSFFKPKEGAEPADGPKKRSAAEADGEAGEGGDNGGGAGPAAATAAGGSEGAGGSGAPSKRAKSVGDTDGGEEDESSAAGAAATAEEDTSAMTPQQRETYELLELERTTMAPDWFKAFKSEMSKPYFLAIKRFLAKEKAAGPVFPPDEDIYSFTRCALSKIKVVILGQDPYHGAGQAHGMCFSVRRGVRVPPSLVNIYKELESDLGRDVFKAPGHGCLEAWAAQGVLMLNATLTVASGKPNSHANSGWQTFTDAVIAHINRARGSVVFMLWGGFAQKKGKAVDKKKHLVLTATHPSPLGANNGGWFGCKHFSKANAFLRERGVGEVDWAVVRRD